MDLRLHALVSSACEQDHGGHQFAGTRTGNVGISSDGAMVPWCGHEAVPPG